jgi:hypothetical protein
MSNLFQLGKSCILRHSQTPADIVRYQSVTSRCCPVTQRSNRLSESVLLKRACVDRTPQRPDPSAIGKLTTHGFDNGLFLGREAQVKTTGEKFGAFLLSC